nr:VP2 [Porcine polyomavirus]
MGILLAIPEIVAATVAAGAEAAEIAGGAAAIATGEGIAGLQAVTDAAVANAALEGVTIGGTLAEQAAAAGVSQAAITAITQTPELVNTLIGAGGVINAAAGAAGGIAQYLIGSNTGGVSGEPGTAGSGGLLLTDGVPYSTSNPHPSVNPGMELAIPTPGDLETGIPGVPDWVLNLVPELPSLSEVVSRIAYGIWTSYYRTGSELIRRAASEELQRLLAFANTLATDSTRYAIDYVQNSDPVGAIITQIENFQVQQRVTSARLLAEAERGTLNVNSAVQQTVAKIQQFVQDVSQLPVDGYNALSSGVSRLGQWISMPGPSGGTDHYSVASWVLFVMDELQNDFYPKQAIYTKFTEDVSQKKSSKRKRSAKATYPNKKRRS